MVATNRRVSVSGRLLTLNAINLGAGPAGFPQISATINATAYLVPPTQGLLNGATAAGPATGGATAVSTPGSTATTTPAPAAVVSSPVR